MTVSPTPPVIPDETKVAAREAWLQRKAYLRACAEYARSSYRVSVDHINVEDAYPFPTFTAPGAAPESVAVPHYGVLTWAWDGTMCWRGSGTAQMHRQTEPAILRAAAKLLALTADPPSQTYRVEYDGSEYRAIASEEVSRG